MTRAIYDKAIFHRLQQMDRKVYQRARNVLPVTPEPVGTLYKLTSVSIVNGGTGFTSDGSLYWINIYKSMLPSEDPEVINYAIIQGTGNSESGEMTHVDFRYDMMGFFYTGVYTEDISGTTANFTSDEIKVFDENDGAAVEIPLNGLVLNIECSPIEEE